MKHRQDYFFKLSFSFIVAINEYLTKSRASFSLGSYRGHSQQMFTFAIGISCGNTPFVQKHESTTHVNGFVFDSIFSVGKYFVRTFHVLTVSASQNQTYKGLKKNGINKGINPLAIINAGKKPPTPATVFSIFLRKNFIRA